MRLSSAPVARRLARGAVLPVVTLAVVATTTVLPFAPAVAEEEVGSTTTSTTEVAPAEPAAPTADPAAPADPADPAAPLEPEGGLDTAAGTEAPAPAPAGPSCTGGALGVLSGAGAINPLDGRRYYGDLVAPGVLELSVLTETREVSAPVTSVALPDLAELSGGAPVDGGGLTFDADGRLYVVAATDPSGPATEARLYRTAAPLAATNPEATELARTATDRPVDRIAFDSGGLLHLADATGSTVVDPTSGDVVDELTPAEGAALACGRPSQLTAVVDLPEGRADADDQFRLTVTGAGYGGAGPTGLTTGDRTGVQAQAGEVAVAVVVPGASYEVTLTRADGSALDGYDVRTRCAGRSVEVADGTVAFTAPRAPFGRSSTCTFVLVPSADLPTGDVPAAEPGADLRILSSPLPGARATDTRDRSEVGIGLPGMGGLGSVGSILDRDRDDTDRDRSPGDGGIDLDGGQFGLGDQRRSRMPDTQDTDEDVLTGRGGPLDPVLPNTGGPTALAIPVGIGAVVLGALVLTRRRRTA